MAATVTTAITATMDITVTMAITAAMVVTENTDHTATMVLTGREREKSIPPAMKNVWTGRKSQNRTSFLRDRIRLE